MVTIWRPSTPITTYAACAGRSSTVKETRWRFREGYDPYVKAGKGYEFYGFADGKARIFALALRASPESPDNEYPLWLTTGRVLSIGIPVR